MNFNFRTFATTLLRGSALAFTALWIGCASGGGSMQDHGMPPAANSGGAKTHPTSGSSDVLQKGDRVVITFSGLSESPPKHEERIKEDGTINLPMIGDVGAAGLSRRDLEQAIHDKYVPNFYRSMTVTVAPEERFFYVYGQVRSPGRHQYLGDLTLLRAIAAAGDFTDFGNRKKVVVTRTDGKDITVNCDKAQDHPDLDPPIYPDDRIYVPRRYF
jgi:polysaccharide export outer membrane protein